MLASMKDLFLGIGGLPLHPLAVHFAVALFPIALLVLVCVVIKKSWREKYLPAALIGLVLTLPLIFIAQQSGEALSEVLYEPQPHSEYGELLMPLALWTVALAIVLWWSLRKKWKALFSQALGIGVICLSVASLAMSFVVGHSGAEAVWGGRINADQQSVTDSQGNQETNQASGSAITVEEVAKHNKENDCWVIIAGSVYRLDPFISEHPGGNAVLTSLCGKDGTQAFASQHARQALPNAELGKLLIGPLAPTSNEGSSGSAAASTTNFSASDIAKHSSTSDCWTLIETTVYDLSAYSKEHPGGAGNIAALCGKDASSAFANQHGLARTPASVLATMAIGQLEGPATLPSTNIVYGDDD